MKNKQTKAFFVSSKKVFLGLAIAGTLFLGGILVYAAMTVKDEKVNQFQVGNLETSIQEVFTAPAKVTIGRPVQKEVTVKNTGSLNQFVRVMIQPEIKKTIEGETIERLLPSEINKEVLLDFPSADWKEGGDGYYYYVKKLKKGDTTPELFTHVILAGDLDTFYEGSKMTIKLKVESITSAGTNYRKAWWQGTTPTAEPLKSIDDKLLSEKD